MQPDFVVIGAGSAGCVVAARLAEAGYRICLLEAGRRDSHPFIHIPAGVGHLLYDPRYNWMYASEPEEGTYGRPIHTPRGKVLGGSSSINGMLYVRGNPADYDSWAQLGCRGWSYEEVLPLFRRGETYAGGGDPQYRGKTGPLKVEDYRTILPLTHLFVKAAQEAGFAYTPDLNGARQEGVGYAQMTRRGRLRGSTFRTYLQVPAARRNVEVIPNATASSLIIEEGRCVGVRYLQGSQTREVRASREVILSAGSIGSPQVLQLSGIGDPRHLSSVGIDTRLDLPGVGRNLSDHLTVRLVSRLRNLTTINELARGWRLAREVVKFGLTGKGALTFGVTSAMVFCRSREGLESPDLQLLFTPASYVFGKALVLEDDPGMTVAVCPTRPGSRGTVLVDSNNPMANPKIRYAYATDRDDLRVMAAGLAHARNIFGAPVFANYVVEETRPGKAVTDDAQVEEFVRREGSSLYHPVGTCKMGVDDAAVVDPRLKVRGIEGLRVADSSIMPHLTTGNTNAPTIMIGEKAADLIIEDLRKAA
ncbi:MAG: GMC family oxidoreductase [Mesorhizobium sp.]